MKILFILPYDKTYRYNGAFNFAISYASLNLSLLAALVPPEFDAEIKIVDEGVSKPLFEGSFDIVAITCVTSSANRAYELCKYWKNKGSYIVLGGAHPTLMPDEASRHADTIFIGFAEQTFPQFMQDYKNNCPQKIYKHVCNNKHLSMPVPRRDFLSKKYMPIPTILANRGCANHCAYCCIHKMWGNKGLTRPIDEVIDEINRLNTKHYIFLDPSMSSNREYAAELFTALTPLRIKWMGLATIDTVNDSELFNLMIQSGCEGILAGFESINEDSLAGVGKKTNMVGEYKSAVKQYHDANISVLGCFVAGFDGDTRQSLLETVEAIDEIGIDLPRFSILTPFPGTDLFDEYERKGRILTKNWDMYDTMHVVFEPKNMSADELQQTFFQIWKETYKTKRIFRRMNNIKKNRFIGLLPAFGFKFYARKVPKL